MRRVLAVPSRYVTPVETEDEYIERVVGEASELSAAQVATLRALIGPVRRIDKVKDHMLDPTNRLTGGE